MRLIAAEALLLLWKLSRGWSRNKYSLRFFFLQFGRGEVKKHHHRVATGDRMARDWLQAA